MSVAFSTAHSCTGVVMGVVVDDHGAGTGT
jgi:hypothetical protein